jgi:hypothetical protein
MLHAARGATSNTGFAPEFGVDKEVMEVISQVLPSCGNKTRRGRFTTAIVQIH